MPTSKIFCAVCGQTEGPFYQGLCKDCYLKDHPLLSLKTPPSLAICRQCGSYKIEHQWFPLDARKQSLEEAISRAIYVAIMKQLDPDTTLDTEIRIKTPELINELITKGGEQRILVEVTLAGKLIPDSPELTYTEDVEIKLTPSICQLCSQAKRGYFEAILQLRTGPREVTPKELDAVIRLIEEQIASIPQAYIARMIEVRGGVDFYINNKNVARQVANTLSRTMNMSQVSSAKAITIKDGQTLSRLVLALFFSPIRPGDYVNTSKGVLQLIRVMGDNIIGVHQQTNQHIRINDPGQYQLLDVGSLREEWILLSKTPKTAQVMNTQSFQVVEIPLFERLAAVSEGAPLQMISVQDQYYILDAPPVEE